MRRHLTLVFAALQLLALGCATHPPKPAGIPPGVSHVAWVIMHGDGDNPDREFACQSEPRNECIVPINQPDSRAFSDVHLYYHGGGPKTTFSGTLKIGFFEGAATSTQFEVKVIAQKEGSPGRQSMIGMVASKPGTYEVSIDVVATIGDTGKSQPIRDTITVIVR